jgi:hypothetical protein
MFAYNPQTTDRSGEILGAGQMQAAQTNAQMMGQLGSDIGGALAGIGEMYGEIEGRKAKGRAFKDVFKVVGPTMGMSLEQLEGVAGGKIKSDMDWYNVRETMSPYMPSLINLQLGQDRLGVQRDQPFINTGLDNAADIAAGNKTFTGGGGSGNIDRSGMKPVEPPFTMDGATPPDENAPLPPNAGAPKVAPSATPIPGAQRMTPAQWDAMNADLVRRGRQSRGAYPY